VHPTEYRLSGMAVRFLLAIFVDQHRKLLIERHRGMATQTFASWNRITSWLRRLAGLRDAA
jgi:hypothetical protein